jgi:UDP-glucose 4-epimerase
MKVLITGGAGYIGSVTAEALRHRGANIVVLDNLVYGHRAAVEDDVPFYLGSISDSNLIKRIVDEHSVDACIHFAAYAYVGESVTHPSKYFENNLTQTVALLDSLRELGVDKIVFSSTCATYGEPKRIPIDEAHPQWPVNPYGWSKFMIERVLEAYQTAYGLRFVSLRYFNAAGATTRLGEHHDPETHLIPNVLRAANSEVEYVSVFGNDYPTPDGTCIRDYIHVSDLADAHIRALDYLDDGGPSTQLNLGNGRGFSVLDVINAAEAVTGKSIRSKIESRRDGDPPQLIADASLANTTLGWTPALSDIEVIVRSAWEWKLANPAGYGKSDGELQITSAR